MVFSAEVGESVVNVGNVFWASRFFGECREDFVVPSL